MACDQNDFISLILKPVLHVLCIAKWCPCLISLSNPKSRCHLGFQSLELPYQIHSSPVYSASKHCLLLIGMVREISGISMNESIFTIIS